MKFRVIDNGEFNYLDIGLTFPVIDFSTKEAFIEGTLKTRKVSLETCIDYRSEDFFKYFTIRFLGFGFYVARQWSY